MKNGNASTKAITAAIVVIALIAIAWYLTRKTESPEPLGEPAPAPVADDPAAISAELENLGTDDLESELQNITNQIEQL